MGLIYEPKGKAREYSPLALNVYTGGCEHQCRYCYCRSLGAWTATPRPRNLAGLAEEATGASRQILLSFMADPYGPCEAVHRNTRHALSILRLSSCSVAILTKGGTRCLDDLRTFVDWPDGRIKVGATLTMFERATSHEFEPGAADPDDRIAALRVLHEAGVRTWASIEPVVIPCQSLEIIRRSLPYVDAYKVGKLNHVKNTTDLACFAKAAVEMIRDAGRALYVKNDLRPFLPAGYLTEDESNADRLSIQPRP